MVTIDETMSFEVWDRLREDNYEDYEYYAGEANAYDDGEEIDESIEVVEAKLGELYRQRKELCRAANISMDTFELMYISTKASRKQLFDKARKNRGRGVLHVVGAY